MGLNLLERLERSEIGQKLQNDFQNETLAKRKAAVGEIKQITAKEIKVLPGLLEAREKAQAGVKAAQQALQKAKEAYDRAFSEKHTARIQADMRRTQQEKILRDSAPAEIDAFKAEMNKLLDLTRSKGSEVSDHGHRSIIDDKWKRKVYSNSKAVNDRLAYLLSAVRETEEFKLQALEPEKLEARFKEIRRKLPQTGVMQLAS